LQNKLKRKVDLITYNSLAYSDLKDSILEDAKVIYEKTH
jgi:predicted nucleotidyltransferase